MGDVNLPKPAGYTYFCDVCGGNVFVPHQGSWPQACPHCHTAPVALRTTSGDLKTAGGSHA